MNALSRILATTIALAPLCGTAMAAKTMQAAPKAKAQKTAATPKVAKAPKAPALPSLIDDPTATKVKSDTGGIIAFKFTVGPLFTQQGSSTGSTGSLNIEVSDTSGYYKGGTKTAPSTVTGNVAWQQIVSPVDRPSYLPSWAPSGEQVTQSGQNFTLTRVAKTDSYRGTISFTTDSSSANPPRFGAVTFSVVGKNNSWNSRFGQGYPIAQ